MGQLSMVLDDLPESLGRRGARRSFRTSVTGLVTFASCPQRFHWSEVDRLPRRPSAAMRHGTRGTPPHRTPSPGCHDLRGTPRGSLRPVTGRRGPAGGIRHLPRQSLRRRAPDPGGGAVRVAVGRRRRGRSHRRRLPTGGRPLGGGRLQERPPPARTRPGGCSCRPTPWRSPMPASPSALPIGSGLPSSTWATASQEITEDVDGPWLADARTRIDDLVSRAAAGERDPQPSDGMPILRLHPVLRGRAGRGWPPTTAPTDQRTLPSAVSMTMVTGPSLHRSTSMCAPNRPWATGILASASNAGHLVDESGRLFGCGGTGERWAASLADIRQQGELTDHQHPAAGLVHREVHLAVRHRRRPAVPPPWRPSLRHRPRVAVGHPQQHHEPGTDLPHDGAVHPHRGSGDTLDDGPHDHTSRRWNAITESATRAGSTR